MNDDLNRFENWFSPLIAGLSSSERLKLARSIGQKMRRNQSQRIAAQKNPDGSEFEPRKEQPKNRQRKGKIRRTMFNKLKAAKFMRVQATSESVGIGFTGRVARIARVHQLGLRDRVQKYGPEFQYPKRELLGFSQEDEEKMRDAVIEHLENHSKS